VNEWVFSVGGMILTGENWSTGRETLCRVGRRWMNVYWALVEWYRQGKPEVLGEKHYVAWVVDEWMGMEHWWNGTDRRNLKYWGRNLATLPTTNPTRTVLSRTPLSMLLLNTCTLNADGVFVLCANWGWNIQHKMVAQNPSQYLPMWGGGAECMVRFRFHFQAVSLGPPLGFIIGFASCSFMPVLLSFLSSFTNRLRPSGYYTYLQV